MYLLNSRLNGFDGAAFSALDQTYRVVKGSYLRSLPRTQFTKEVDNQNILILVHGFNQSFADILTLYLSFEHRINEFSGSAYDVIIGYIWPGEKKKTDYFEGKDNTIQSGQRLQQWLRQFRQQGCTIDILSLGLASSVVYRALNTQAQISIRNIFSLDFTIPKELMQDDYHTARTVAENITHLYLFYKRDKNLSIDWLKLFRWQDLFSYSSHEVVERLRSSLPRITAIDCSNVLETVADYQDARVLFECIDKLLTGKQYPLYHALQPGLHDYFDSFLSCQKTGFNVLDYALNQTMHHQN